MPSGLWVVARTKPRQERWAAVNVRRQGRWSYLPEYYHRQRRLRMPLFPSYLFVLAREGDFSFLRSTFGISALVTIAGAPATIDRQVIRELRQRENAHGVITLPEQIEADQVDDLRPGDLVKVSEGPMVGLNALYQGMATQGRIRILLDLLNRRGIPVTIERKSVELLAAA